MTNNGPIDVLRDGNIKASIFRNEGEKGVFFSTQFARTYTDKDGTIRDSQSFSGTDQLKVSELGRRAYQRTHELRREETREREPTRGDRQATSGMTRTVPQRQDRSR